MCLRSHFSHVWLFSNPWIAAHQASLSMKFSRQEYWSGLPFPPPGVFLTQGPTCISCVSWTAGGSFTSESLEKPIVSGQPLQIWTADQLPKSQAFSLSQHQTSPHRPKLFWKTEERALPNSSCKASIVLISMPEKHISKKSQGNILHEYRYKILNQNLRQQNLKIYKIENISWPSQSMFPWNEVSLTF